MVRQVRLLERFADSSTRRVFAFGTHELAPAEDIHPVSSASALNQSLRIVMDELLLGNNLEEISCRGNVDEDSNARVPVGADPDDIARCSVANDVLVQTCPGSDSHSVCICARPEGCMRTGSTVPVPMGQPVGVADVNQDGSADNTTFILGAVGLQCGTHTIDINLDSSYWNPSGDQNRPAMGGFDALGPAIVLVPAGPLPTNINCRLVFAADVVDKQGERVCTPANGDIDAPCTPGNVDAFSFGTEPLAVDAASFFPGEQGVDRNGPLRFSSNVPLATATAAGITIAPTPPGTVTITTPMPNVIEIAFGTPLLPNTDYTVTIPTTVTDRFGQAIPMQKTYSFRTGA